MPTYSYACTACGHRFDVQQSFSDAALTECPECTGRLRKVFSAVGVVFKGSGFYRTDSRSGGAGSESAKTDSTKTDSSKADSSKADSTSGSGSAGTSSGGPSGGTSSSTPAKPASAPAA